MQSRRFHRKMSATCPNDNANVKMNPPTTTTHLALAPQFGPASTPPTTPQNCHLPPVPAYHDPCRPTTTRALTPPPRIQLAPTYPTQPPTLRHGPLCATAYHLPQHHCPLHVAAHATPQHQPLPTQHGCATSIPAHHTSPPIHCHHMPPPADRKSVV